MKKAGREWVRPELTVIVRSMPEEAVLAACKATTGAEGPAGSTRCGAVGASTCNTVGSS